MAAAGFLSHYLSGPFTIYLTPYNRKYNVFSASLNKTFPSFLRLAQTNKDIFGTRDVV